MNILNLSPVNEYLNELRIDSRHPAISADPNCQQVHIIWEDDYDNIVHLILDIDTGNTLSETVLTNGTSTTTSSSTVPNIAVIWNIAHIVWTDDRDGGYNIYFTLSEGPACSVDGGTGTSPPTTTITTTGDDGLGCFISTMLK